MAKLDNFGVPDRSSICRNHAGWDGDDLHGEVFKFASPTIYNESKTLSLLIIEESHKADDQKRSGQLAPMLASTGGVTWTIGVGATRMCDSKRGCDKEPPDFVGIIVPVDQVIADRWKKFEQSDNPRHLEYEKAFDRQLRNIDNENPEILRKQLPGGRGLGRQLRLARAFDIL